jgi:hypothetical protein
MDINKTREDIVNNLNPVNAASHMVESGKKTVSDIANKAKSYWDSSVLHKAISGEDKPTTFKYDEKALKNTSKPKPSYKTGTTYVPKTGPATLHKGEAVLKKEDAEKYRSHLHGAAAALGADEDKPKKEIKHIVTKKAKNGGYIHEHHHTRPEHHPMEEHVSPDQDSMVGHMMEHMGEPNPGEAEADAGNAGMPGADGGM